MSSIPHPHVPSGRPTTPEKGTSEGEPTPAPAPVGRISSAAARRADSVARLRQLLARQRADTPNCSTDKTTEDTT